MFTFKNISYNKNSSSHFLWL